jgi:hypothetical protein
MHLFQLAYCCRLYGEITRYDASIDEMRSATRDGGLDLHDAVHTEALLRWLNNWGCRQFAVEYHGSASEMLGFWSDRWLSALPASDASLSVLDLSALEAVGNAYVDLASQQASTRRLGGDRMSVVTVGPTGAAKILHALRPEALPPWDSPIRAARRYRATRGGYLTFLQDVQGEVRRLEAEAAAVGITGPNIPSALGRPASSLPKMIDEYYWVTITRGHVPASTQDVAQWNAWAHLERAPADGL